MLNKLLSIIKKPLYPHNETIQLSKWHCWLSLGVTILLLIINCLIFFVLKDSFIYVKIVSGKSTAFDRVTLGAYSFVTFVIVLSLFLIITKQPLNSVGITKSKLSTSIIIALPMVILVNLAFVVANRFGMIFLWNTIFYVLFIGFYEEILFRGFLWSRMQYLFGKRAGFIVTGILFGIFHVPMKVIWFESDIIMITFNVIGSGLVGHLFYGYLYTRYNNVVLPSLIHGYLDLMSKLF